jgi:hypothetical protein
MVFRWCKDPTPAGYHHVRFKQDAKKDLSISVGITWWTEHRALASGWFCAEKM